jgi:hypothetical protein
VLEGNENAEATGRVVASFEKRGDFRRVLYREVGKELRPEIEARGKYTIAGRTFTILNVQPVSGKGRLIPAPPPRAGASRDEKETSVRITSEYMDFNRGMYTSRFTRKR